MFRTFDAEGFVFGAVCLFASVEIQRRCWGFYTTKQTKEPSVRKWPTLALQPCAAAITCKATLLPSFLSVELSIGLPAKWPCRLSVPGSKVLCWNATVVARCFSQHKRASQWRQCWSYSGWSRFCDEDWLSRCWRYVNIQVILVLFYLLLDCAIWTLPFGMFWVQLVTFSILQVLLSLPLVKIRVKWDTSGLALHESCDCSCPVAQWFKGIHIHVQTVQKPLIFLDGRKL